MVVYQVFQAGNARSERESVLRRNPFSNRFLFLATAAALSIHVAALYLPPTQYVLRVEPIEYGAWIRATTVASTVIVAGQLLQVLRARRRHRSRGKIRRDGVNVSLTTFRTIRFAAALSRSPREALRPLPAGPIRRGQQANRGRRRIEQLAALGPRKCTPNEVPVDDPGVRGLVVRTLAPRARG